MSLNRKLRRTQKRRKTVVLCLECGQALTVVGAAGATPINGTPAEAVARVQAELAEDPGLEKLSELEQRNEAFAVLTCHRCGTVMVFLKGRFVRFPEDRLSRLPQAIRDVIARVRASLFN